MANKKPNTKGLIRSISDKTPIERREQAKKAGIKSGEVRREKALFKKLGYTGVESFDRLNMLQEKALQQNNITAALKAEELKGKLAGLYVDKTAQTDSLGNDIPEPPVYNIVPVRVIHDERDTDTGEDDLPVN